jgi:hypothetical protein
MIELVLQECHIIQRIVRKGLDRLPAGIHASAHVDDMDEDDPLKESIKSLPSLLFRTSATGDWQLYGASAFDSWKQDATAAAVSSGIADMDF